MRARKGAANLEALRAFGLFTQLGLSMAACALVGVLAGSRLDKWLRTSPWMLLLFSFLGVAAAFKAMYDIVIKRWSKK
jgi:ATP synthase protein I